MSFAEKHEVSTKEEWMKLLEENDLGRSNMNRLIMNYLVTGICYRCILAYVCNDNLFLEGFKEAAEKFQQESGLFHLWNCIL